MCSHESGGKLRGILKCVPEDFVVEEIDRAKNVVSAGDGRSYGNYKDGTGDFLHLVMVKRNVDTISAVGRICSKLGILEKRVCYAGVKDRVAVSAQRIGIYRLPLERVRNIKLKDLKLFVVGRGGKIYLGDLWGNRFTVCVRNVNMSPDGLEDYVNRKVKRLRGRFPNYFGKQRFGGARPVTFHVGLELIRGNLSGAVEMYVCRVFPDEDDFVSKIRRVAGYDKRRALEMFPKSYVYERVMIEHLLAHEGDYYGAFMRLPFGLRKMFVSAVQSYVFNETLKMMLDDGVCDDGLRIPVVGYSFGRRIVEGKADGYVERVLRREKIDPSMFKLKIFPELSSEGNYRQAFERFYDFEVVSVEKDDRFEGSKAVLRFSLPKGCYATVFLSEFFDFS